MIARMWHGMVPVEKAAAYHEYLKISGLSDYNKTPGNKGVYLLSNEKDGVIHFYTLTFWDDYDAIRRFAGDNFQTARYYPEDKDFLLEFEREVTHFEVLEKPDYL